MSEHRIEDLVEDGVRSILKSDRPDAEKVQLAAKLYDFQARYDTSDTIGRLKPELDAIGFKRRATAALPLLSAIGAVVADADPVVVHDWIAALAEGIYDGQLRDDLPGAFMAFITDKSALSIREAAIRNDVAGLKSSRSRFRLKSWKSYRGSYSRLDATSLERKHMLRFITDLAEPVDAIIAGYEADRTKLAALATAPITRLPQLMATQGEFHFVGYEEVGFSNRPVWTFLIGEKPEDPDATRYYLTITHERDFGDVLVPAIGVQSGVLRQWQGEPFDSHVVHFSRDIGVLLKEDVLLADPNFAKGRVGWPYKIDQSETLLVRRLEAIAGFVPAMLKAVRSFYGKSLRELLDKNTAEELLRKRQKLAIEKGFFVNRVEIMFASACRALERGDGPSQRMLDHIAALVDATHETHPLKVEWAAALERLQKGEIAFPQIGSVRMAAKLHNEVEEWRD